MVVALAAATLWLPPVGAQAPARGQNVAPAYEGFWRNADGTFDLMFGYYNRNWEEEIDLPVGPGNTLDPGGPDQGQPTHFFPRRNQFVFKVRVPANFGNKEVVWTLTSNGQTEKAYATLRPQYAVDETVMMANFGAGGQTGFVPDMMGNKPPELKVEGEKKRTAKVGEPVTLSAVATDDGKPKTRPMPAFLVGQSHFLPNAATGLRLSWFTYRGAGKDSVRPAADEGLAGPPGRRQFPLVGRLEHTAAAARKHVDGEGDVQRAGHLRAARARQRRRSHRLRRRDGDGRSLN